MWKTFGNAVISVKKRVITSYVKFYHHKAEGNQKYYFKI